MESSPTRVLVRVRPTIAIESNTDAHVNCNATNEIKCADGDTHHTFTFDHVFAEETAQEEIYREVQSIVQGVTEGVNGTILTYGQTGSGKTHTLIGDLSNEKDQGIVPRAAKELMQKHHSKAVFVTVSAAEIYCERILDLLDSANVDLQVKEDSTKGVHIAGLVELTVREERELQATMQRAIGNRTVGSTAMNNQSSRSHCIINIQFRQKTAATAQAMGLGRLCLVDLAGSERVSKTEASGVSLDEGILINKSLSALANVICALTDKKTRHIPYRDSKLTRVLQDSLGGNSKTALIICCSPVKSNLNETLCSLRFGSRAKGITNTVQRGSVPITLEEKLTECHAECERLRREMARLTDVEHWWSLLWQPLNLTPRVKAALSYRVLFLAFVQFFFTTCIFLLEDYWFPRCMKLVGVCSATCHMLLYGTGLITYAPSVSISLNRNCAACISQSEERIKTVMM